MTSREKLLKLRTDFYKQGPVDYDSIDYFTAIEQDLKVLEMIERRLKVNIFGNLQWVPYITEREVSFTDTDGLEGTATCKMDWDQEAIKLWLKEEEQQRWEPQARKAFFEAWDNVYYNDKQNYEINEFLKSKLEMRSLAPGIEDIVLKGTDTIVVYNEDDNYEKVKEWLENDK